MKIIKNGKTHKSIKCIKCDCEFCFTKKDTFFSREPLTLEKVYFVKCPECDFSNYVERGDRK